VNLHLASSFHHICSINQHNKTNRMRKLLLSTTLLLLMFQFASAQNASPYWSLEGNSNANASSKLGTTNSVPLRIHTKNIERIRIDTAGRVGIGTTTPTERLQVNSASGKNPLRVQVNGNTKMLVHNAGGVSIGSDLTPPANGLFVNGNVGVGTASPSSQLHILGSSAYVTALRVDTGSIRVTNKYTIGDSSIGVYGEGGIGISGKGQRGVQGEGHYGVWGVGTSIGVYGHSTQGTGKGVQGYSNFTGVYAYGGNYGVYAVATKDFGYAGSFQGNVYTTGTYQPSARQLKHNIAELNGAMALISKLQPKEYEYKQEGSYGLMNLPKGKRYGLIAEEVEEVLPTLIKATEFDRHFAQGGDSETNTGEQASEKIDFKAVNYTELIPIMIKGMQEQQVENETLKDRVAKLEELILALKNGSTSPVTITSAYLNQNTPNPVSGSTTIRYHIPEQSTSARLTLTNAKGQVIKTINLNNRGAGQLSLATSSMAAGTYHYTLYVDGRQADTKRFVVAR
jgi:hypothetical protein